MTSPKQTNQLEDLLNQIDKHDEAYYNDGKPLISDQEYDGLKDRLRSISKDFFAKQPKNKDEVELEIRVRDTLSRVGTTLPKDGKWPKVEHLVPMQSLNKCNTPEELDIWLKKCTSK